jgi:hypothetical protein
MSTKSAKPQDERGRPPRLNPSEMGWGEATEVRTDGQE